MQSKIIFVNKAISSCFFFLFLIIDLFFLILAKIFNPIVEILIHLKISIKKAKAEMEIHTVTATSKVRNYLM